MHPYDLNVSNIQLTAEEEAAAAKLCEEAYPRTNWQADAAHGRNDQGYWEAVRDRLINKIDAVRIDIKVHAESGNYPTASQFMDLKSSYERAYRYAAFQDPWFRTYIQTVQKEKSYRLEALLSQEAVIWLQKFVDQKDAVRITRLPADHPNWPNGYKVEAMSGTFRVEYSERTLLEALKVGVQHTADVCLALQA